MWPQYTRPGFLWCHYCATQAGQKQTYAVKNTGICTSVTSCPITHVSVVTNSRLTLPQAKDRLPPLIWAQHAAMVHAGALWGVPYNPPHFLEGSVGEAWKLPNGGIFTRWRGAPLSSPPPLTSTATWPKAMRMPPGFTLSSLVHKQRFIVAQWGLGFSTLDRHSDCVDTKYCWSLQGNYNLRVRF